MSIGLFGAGRVGTAVAHLLQLAGHDVAVVSSRSPDSSERAAGLLGAPVARWGSPPDTRLDLMLIGVTDDALSEAVEVVKGFDLEGTIVAHFAGVFGTAPLEGLASHAGARPAALHPVQACPDVDTALRRLPGSAWGVTCGHELIQWATTTIERDLFGVPIPVAEDARPVWHAAAVTVSNGIAALLAAGEKMLDAIGIDDKHVVLSPLARGTVLNAEEARAAVLTGPIVRGDIETVRRHVLALERHSPELRHVYELVSAILSAQLPTARHDTFETSAEIAGGGE